MGCATSKESSPPGSLCAERGRRKIYATRFDASAPEGQAVTGNGFLLSGADVAKKDRTDDIDRERMMRSTAVARRIQQVTTLACLCPAFDTTDFPDLPQSSRRQTSRRRSTVFASNSTSRTTSPRPLFAASITSSHSTTTINVLTPTSARSPLVSQTSSFHRLLDGDDGSGSASLSAGHGLSEAGLLVSDEGSDEEEAEQQARRLHIQLDDDCAAPRAAGYEAPEPTQEQLGQRIAAIVGPAIRAGRVNRDPNEFSVVGEHPQYILHSERIVRPWLDDLLTIAAEAAAHSPRGRGSVMSAVFASPADTELASETSSGPRAADAPAAAPLWQPVPTPAVTAAPPRPPWLPLVVNGFETPRST